MTTINYTIDQYIPKGGSIVINLPTGMSAAEILGGSTGVSISSIGGNVLISSGLSISSDGGTRSSTITMTNNTGAIIQPLGPVLITMTGVELNAGTIVTPIYDSVGNTSGIGLAQSPYISSSGGSSRGNVVNNALAASSYVRAAKKTLLANSLGPNGTLRINLDVEVWSGTATVYVVLGGQTVIGLASTTTFNNQYLMYNKNDTQAQRCIRPSDGTIYNLTVDTTKDLPIEVYINKATAADVIILRRFEIEAQANFVKQEEAYYLTSSGPQTVVETDLLQYPLSSAATNDPRNTIRNLTATPYTFPSKFFNVCSITYPVSSSTLPVNTKGLRSMDFPGTGWASMQTAQATVQYGTPTGAAPTGISAAGLAKLDALFAAANTNGIDLIVSILSDSGTAPGWMTTLGGTYNPISIPAAGANRTALLASLGFYVQYLCQRYTTMYPTLTWYIEPLNEPNTSGVWSGVVADFVAVINTINTAISTYGAGKVTRLSSSWTDVSGISFLNTGSPTLATTRQSYQEYISNGGWAQFDVITYHLYGGTVWYNDVNLSNPYRQQGLFQHVLRLLDPLYTGTTQGNQYSIPAMLNNAGVGQAIVPGVSLSGKPLWITECGDAYVGTRDRKFFIRLALIASALGVSKYFFYYWGNLTNGALPDMDIANCTDEFIAAQNFLLGKTINWVNANIDLTKVAANINGVIYQF